MADDHFSYSQLRQFETCPYSYFLSRYCDIKAKPSGFSQAGSLMHQILAGWAKGELQISELSALFAAEYETQVTEPFPKYLGADYGQKLYKQCMYYLTSFKGFPEFDIVAAEQTLETEIAGEKFVGIVDLILRNEKGELFLVDHKSSSKITRDMFRQLYLYSKLIMETYGSFPSILLFNKFKTGQVDVQIFSTEKYEETIAWAEKMIRAIKEADIDDWLLTKKEAFFCENLCGCRDVCSIDGAE